jgi:hypothetical protein
MSLSKGMSIQFFVQLCATGIVFFTCLQIHVNGQAGPQGSSETHIPSLFLGEDFGYAMTLGCYLYFVAICFLFYWLREQGGTFHERVFKQNTLTCYALLVPAVSAFWTFIAHVVALVFSQWNQEIRRSNETFHLTIGPTFGKQFISWVEGSIWKFAFIIHLVSAIPICLLAGFQFVPYFQRLGKYCVHRCCGRVILVATCFQQLSASIMLVDNLFMNMPGEFEMREDDPSQPNYQMLWYRFAFIGFLVQNFISWNAVIRGFAAARRKEISNHVKWMMRLAAGWVIPVIFVRMLGVVNVAHPGWLNIFAPWINNIVYIPLEIYIRKSGRFRKQVWVHPQVNFSIDQSRCPLLSERKVSSATKSMKTSTLNSYAMLYDHDHQQLDARL